MIDDLKRNQDPEKLVKWIQKRRLINHIKHRKHPKMLVGVPVIKQPKTQLKRRIQMSGSKILGVEIE